MAEAISNELFENQNRETHHKNKSERATLAQIQKKGMRQRKRREEYGPYEELWNKWKCPAALLESAFPDYKLKSASLTASVRT